MSSSKVIIPFSQRSEPVPTPFRLNDGICKRRRKKKAEDGACEESDIEDKEHSSEYDDEVLAQ